MTRSNEQIALRVSWQTLVCNVILSALKLAAGLIANSAAMVSDAVHSLSDVLSTVVVMIGVKLAGQKSDKRHPYGHERFECVAAVILAAMLFGVGMAIGLDGVKRIIAGTSGGLRVPGGFALIAAAGSIAVKEAMYWYTRAAALKTGSGALMADAWHHRSDALSSVGSFIGILGARIGLPVLDPVACLVICAFILKVSVDIFRDAVGKMTDSSCSDEFVEEIRSVVLEQENVLGVDQLMTRRFGDKIYVDIEISADGSATLKETHLIAEGVHSAIETRFANVKHCMVHVNPAGDGADQ